jgi:hypothetical protein
MQRCTAGFWRNVCVCNAERCCRIGWLRLFGWIGLESFSDVIRFGSILLAKNCFCLNQLATTLEDFVCKQDLRHGHKLLKHYYGVVYVWKERFMSVIFGPAKVRISLKRMKNAALTFLCNADLNIKVISKIK